VKAAAEEFGVSEMTVWRLLRTGKLTKHARAHGRPRVFVDRRELRKLLEPKPTRKRS
jgi:hypothetical protein